MKVIIAGGRNIYLSVGDIQQQVDASGFDITEVVCGGANGIDAAGAAWANSMDIPVQTFFAHWKTQGRAAGPLRNARMAEYADGLILIWDGQSSGSKSMLSLATERSLSIHQQVIT